MRKEVTYIFIGNDSSLITSAEDENDFTLFVGLSAGLYKNYRMDFYEAWMEDVPRPRIDSVNF